MKRLITVMLISIAVISIQILWAYDALLDEYPKGYGFDVAKMKQLEAEIDRAEQAEKDAQAALAVAEAAQTSCELAAAEDEANNKPPRSCAGEAAAVEAAQQAVDQAREALQ